MGAAYYVVLNEDEPGFDTTIDGKALSRHSRPIDPRAVKDPEAVLDDLQAMSTVLAEAKKRGLKWHLQVDF
jgi:hypothetical protein